MPARAMHNNKSVFHLFKHDWLKGKNVYDHIELNKQIIAFANHIGNRYFGELYGITPNQILAGATINKQKFKDQKQQAKIKRLEDNKAFNGCVKVTYA